MRGCRRTAFAALALGVALTSATALARPESARREAQSSLRPAADAATDATFTDPDLGDASDPASQALGEPTGVTARLADWITASNDNDDLPFMIVDKRGADVFAFDASGQLLGHAPVLVGLARGDDSAPGIGELALSAIRPDERTTPAGRFVAHFGPSSHGTVLWVDYADAISMHPVITTNPREHRLQRIKSASPKDHRISFGCINVPAKFYHDVVAKARHGVVVYILPDTKPLADIFPAFAAADRFDPDGEARSEPDRCADPLLDMPDRIPDPDPTNFCPAGDRRTTDARSP